MTDAAARTAPDAAPLRPRDLPTLEKRVEGETDHDYVRRHRALAPAAKDKYGMINTWSLAGMTEALDARHTRQIETETARLMGVTSGPIWDFFSNTLLLSNGEAHKARRTPLARSFAHPLMRALRPEVRALSEELLRPRLGAPTEVLADFSGPLPAMLIARILGLPEGDLPHFTELVYSAMRVLTIRSPEIWAEAAADLGELNDYVAALLAERRARPADDFLTEYLGRVEGGPLSEAEVRMQVVTLILAGADTTRISLASTLSQLMQNRGQWDLLVADPEGRKEGAASEGLRFDPVIGSLPRIVTADTVIDGVALKEGSIVAPSMLGALRDPAVYADPDRFDIARADHPRWHPIFGGGAHRCLGEALARTELEEALAAIATLAPGTVMTAQPPEMRGFGGTRSIGPVHLRLAT